MSSTAGIVIGACALALFLMAFGRRGRPRDLGSVSRTWIIENRSDRRGDHD